MTDDNMTITIDGKTVDAARLLVALYARAQAYGLGAIHAAAAPDFTVDVARALLTEMVTGYAVPGMHPFRFDYVHGRSIKVRANKDGSIDDTSRQLFDRDSGEGAFDRAVEDALRP